MKGGHSVGNTRKLCLLIFVWLVACVDCSPIVMKIDLVSQMGCGSGILTDI